jgi:CRP-like cAMP-binding protein
MDEQSVTELLRGVGFLEGIDEDNLQRLAKDATARELQRGEILFHEGEPALDFLCVARGDISLEVQSPEAGNRQITTVGAGEILGWASVLQLGRLTATARAISPTVVVFIPSRTILSLCETKPGFGYEFMRRTAHTLATRLEDTRMYLLQISGAKLPLADAERT